MFNTQSLVNGGKAFKPGAIGLCDICRNKAELGEYDCRSICEDCFKAMEHGRQKNETEADYPEPFLPKIPEQSPSNPSPNTSNDSEKRRYLEVISSASHEIITSVINQLVTNGVLEYDFHKIIQNERWFSLMDLRRIALQVDPLFDRPILHKEVKPKGEKKCLTMQKTKAKARSRTTKNRLGPLHPPQPQHLLPVQAEPSPILS